MTALNRKDFNILLPLSTLSLLKTISACLDEFGANGYIVGGFIRDVILGRDIADIDIAISADALDFSPKLAQALEGKFIAMDKENKVGRVILKNTDDVTLQQVDISTIRENIEEDLSQRDFTIDAMALPIQKITNIIKEDDIIDPFNGMADIQRKIIRVVSDKALEMDALRLLRGARLSTELVLLSINRPKTS